jgi:mono/diheme cytochrome c family protein
MRVAILAALALVGTSAAESLVAQQDARTQAVAAASTQPRGAASTASAPTFYADVLPILQQNCQTCHQAEGKNMGGMVAPFALVTYDEARRYAGRIADAIRTGHMPPWSAAEMHRGMFKDERYLEDEEKQTLFAWVEAGAPAGDPSAAPPQPDFLTAAAATGGWSMGEPDLILSFPEPYCLDDDLRDIYVNLPVQITDEMLPEDKWIESVEYRNGPAVHHIISSVSGLVPGAEPQYYAEGYGRVMRAGPREVMFNMHFNKEPGPGTALCTNIQAGIRFKEDGEVIRFVTGGDNLRIRDWSIPPGESSYSASTEYTFEEDVELLGFMPHMHLRGKAALYEATYPDGQHETLLHVPDYDFNWQHSYDYKEPKLIPAGTVLRFTLWWDNSENNPANPDPTATVTWGLPTHAEMSQGYMRFQSLKQVNYVVGDPVPASLTQQEEEEDNEAN